MSVYVDKTPPIIDLVCNNNTERFIESKAELLKKSDNVKITTSDNIAIKYNEYYYNSNTNDFTGKEPCRFDNTEELREDGYYKVVGVDTSGNTTEITLLIDKTPPEITYRYFKKGLSLAKREKNTIVGVQEYKSSSNIISLEEKNNNKILDTEIKGIEQIKQNRANRNFLMTGGTVMVYNESDLRWALDNGFSTIVTATSIDCSNPLTIRGNVKIQPSSSDNAIRYGGYGSFITVENGATLDLTAMVIDTERRS